MSKKNLWYKTRYGSPDMKGRWTISDGQIQFDIHPLFSGGFDGRTIVSEELADRYAEEILNLLNKDRLDVREVK